MIAVISLLHYNTHWHIHALHGIYRRLYYFPIILAAFRGGPVGGVGAALLVIALYVPHAFGLIGFDPGTTVEKILEMLLYLLVGLLTGTLVARINAARDRQKRTAEDLRVTLDQKTAMEAELVRSARMAAVGRLSAGLAHEIRNPLASIKGSAEVLADDFPADHPKGRMFAILQEETGRLNQVLSRFLAFARSEPGEVAPFDLEQECRAVAQLMEHRPEPVDRDGHRRPDVPAASGNREQVRQVLLNLALNAAAAAGPAASSVSRSKPAPARSAAASSTPDPDSPPRPWPISARPFSPPRRMGPAWGWPPACASSRTWAALWSPTRRIPGAAAFV